MTELEPRPVSASRIELVRGMTLLDANGLGNVHGGVIMRMIDDAAGTAASRFCLDADTDLHRGATGGVDAGPDDQQVPDVHRLEE